MSLNIKNKRSAVAGSTPTPAQLEDGEIGVNYNSTDPALYIKDSSGAVVRIAGDGAVGTTPADATTTSKGVVQLADAAAVTAGTAGVVVDAAQLKAVADAVDAEDLWDRSGTELSPKTAGDDVFTSGSVKVGGTTAAPEIELKADGGIISKTDGLVFDATNKWLGVGTANPGASLHVAGNNNGGDFVGQIIQNTGTDLDTSVELRLRLNTDYPDKKYAGIKAIGTATYNNKIDLAFYTLNGTTPNAGLNQEQVRITGDGYLRLSSNSRGIQFNGDTAAANALDDYEEGTWTPTGGTWKAAGGTYVKTGSTVVVIGWASAGGGQLLDVDEIGGLPFAYLSQSFGNGSYMVFAGQDNPPIGVAIIPDAYGNTMNIGSTSLKVFPTFSRTNTGVAGGDRIQFTLVYRV